MDLAVFRGMGLEDREAKVYLALLELGASKASQVAEKTGIERTVVYKLLGRLVEKKLASYSVRENRRYFQAADPSELVDLLEERKERLQEVLPALKKMMFFEEAKHVCKADVFSGGEGLRAVMRDILREAAKAGRRFCTIGDISRLFESSAYYPKWSNARVKIGIYWDEITYNKPAKKKLHRCLLTERAPKLPFSLAVYGNKSLISYTKIPWGESRFVGVVIISRDAAKQNREFFLKLWKTAEKSSAASSFYPYL